MAGLIGSPQTVFELPLKILAVTNYLLGLLAKIADRNRRVRLQTFTVPPYAPTYVY